MKEPPRTKRVVDFLHTVYSKPIETNRKLKEIFFTREGSHPPASQSKQSRRRCVGVKMERRGNGTKSHGVRHKGLGRGEGASRRRTVRPSVRQPAYRFAARSEWVRSVVGECRLVVSRCPIRLEARRNDRNVPLQGSSSRWQRRQTHVHFCSW